MCSTLKADCSLSNCPSAFSQIMGLIDGIEGKFKEKEQSTFVKAMLESTWCWLATIWSLLDDACPEAVKAQDLSKTRWIYWKYNVEPETIACALFAAEPATCKDASGRWSGWGISGTEERKARTSVKRSLQKFADKRKKYSGSKRVT